jgi:hypothetical protein
MPRVHAGQPTDVGLRVAIEGAVFTLPDGSEYFVRRGATYRADDAVVLHSPGFFLTWPCTTQDLEAARARLIYERQEEVAKVWPDQR